MYEKKEERKKGTDPAGTADGRRGMNACLRISNEESRKRSQGRANHNIQRDNCQKLMTNKNSQIQEA